MQRLKLILRCGSMAFGAREGHDAITSLDQFKNGIESATGLLPLSATFRLGRNARENS